MIIIGPSTGSTWRERHEPEQVKDVPVAVIAMFSGGTLPAQMMRALGLVGNEVAEAAFSFGACDRALGGCMPWVCPATDVATSTIIGINKPTSFMAPSRTAHSLSYSDSAENAHWYENGTMPKLPIGGRLKQR
jgi:hypothetical protein